MRPVLKTFIPETQRPVPRLLSKKALSDFLCPNESHRDMSSETCTCSPRTFVPVFVPPGCGTSDYEGLVLCFMPTINVLLSVSGSTGDEEDSDL